MSRSRHYPESWVWLRPGTPVPGRPEDQADSYPVVACVRTLDIACAIAQRLGLEEPIIQTRMPYHRAVCKLEWWSRHAARPYRNRRR